MASPQGPSVGKTEPPDYIFMFPSANVPGITCKINFGYLCPLFLGKMLRVPPSVHEGLNRQNIRKIKQNTDQKIAIQVLK